MNWNLFGSQFWILRSPRSGGSIWWPLCCIITWEMAEDITWMRKKQLNSSIYMECTAIIMAFTRSESSWANHFLKIPPINTVLLGIKFPTHDLRDTFKPQKFLRDSCLILSFFSLLALFIYWFSARQKDVLSC